MRYFSPFLILLEFLSLESYDFFQQICCYDYHILTKYNIEFNSKNIYVDRITSVTESPSLIYQVNYLIQIKKCSHNQYGNTWKRNHYNHLKELLDVRTKLNHTGFYTGFVSVV